MASASAGGTRRYWRFIRASNFDVRPVCDSRRMMNARILAGRLAELLRREHAEMADFLVALAEFDACKVWKELGYSSLFYFLHRKLGLSKGAAHYRKTAAGLVQRFPEIVEPLRDGRLCITSIVYLDKVLTPENRHETLPKFFQRSRQESIAIAAAEAALSQRSFPLTASRPQVIGSGQLT